MYYARVKIKGVDHKRSLETKKRDVARVKLGGVIDQIKKDVAAPVSLDMSDMEGCVQKWLAEQDERPDLKPSMHAYNKRRARVIRDTLPMSGDVSADRLREWWAHVAGRYHASFANNLLSTVQTLVDIQVQAGLRPYNEARDLKRVKLVQSIRHIPSPAAFNEMAQNVRAQKRAGSEEAADFIEWAAYTGMRPAEIGALAWGDVGVEFIVVRGGEHGTKNRKERMVPIMSALVDLIARRRQPGGPVFHIASPKRALDNVCERLKVPHLRVYDLRHIFATRCIESGVDFATVAKWLGHSDGGALCVRVYGHVRDAHGLEQAKRVEF